MNDGNLVEGGLTLMLHITLLDWSEDVVEAMGPYNYSEPSWERKVQTNNQ